MSFKSFKLSFILLATAFIGSAPARGAETMNTVELCFEEHNGCVLTTEATNGRFGVTFGPAFHNKLNPLWDTIRSLEDSRLIYNLIAVPQQYEQYKEKLRLRMASAGYNKTIPTVWLSKTEAEKLREELALDRETLNTNVDLCEVGVGACGLTILSTVASSGVSVGLTVLTCGASFLQCKATYTSWKQYQLKLDDYLDSIGKDGAAGGDSSGSINGGDGANLGPSSSSDSEPRPGRPPRIRGSEVTITEDRNDWL